MEFKLVSKKNVGIVITLMLVILLCVSKFFNSILDTYLGRVVLIIFVILISYTHKVLGLLAVLFIIIAFNNNSNTVSAYNYYESFGGLSNSNSNNSKAEDIKKQVNIINKNSNMPSQIATTTSSVASSSMPENFYSGREGFGITDRETNMLRGKSSNTIPVFNNSREQTDDVSPTDKSVFTDSYSSV